MVVAAPGALELLDADPDLPGGILDLVADGLARPAERHRRDQGGRRLCHAPIVRGPRTAASLACVRKPCELLVASACNRLER